jgi:hypothetical protein
MTTALRLLRLGHVPLRFGPGVGGLGSLQEI